MDVRQSIRGLEIRLTRRVLGNLFIHVSSYRVNDQDEAIEKDQEQRQVEEELDISGQTRQKHEVWSAVF